MFIFDVDGTLTPSRRQIDEEFKKWIFQYIENDFVVVTGSDPSKTIEQLGEDFFNSITCFNCSGNHIFINGIEHYKSNWKLPNKIENYLSDELKNSVWSIKTGNHIEHRVGLCNFSILGRNATIEQRRQYVSYDLEKKERFGILDRMEKKFSDIDVRIAGETGIDIYEKGKGKDQILNFIDSTKNIIFFGDRQKFPGNDYDLAKKIVETNRGICIEVNDWNETAHILKKLKGH
jgi:phosphomannomutase